MSANRTIRRLVLIAIGFLSGPALSAEARQARAIQQTATMEFRAVSDLSYNPGATVVIGARPADPADYPASFYASSAKGMCTSALVGRRAMLTAAHCVADHSTIALAMGNNRWSATCTHAPGYRKKNKTADWALCALDADAPNVPYERINVDPALIKTGDEVLLTGFGCTKPGGGGNDGIYRIGEAPVHALPQGTNNDIVTRAPTALCFGDSGGPAFRFLDLERTQRVQVGVNSRGDLRKISHLSSTSTQEARQFFESWAQQTGARICGLHSDAAGCR